METEPRYRILRYYREENRPPDLIREGATLAEAQAHCQREDTHGPDWFDAYTREGPELATPLDGGSRLANNEGAAL